MDFIGIKRYARYPSMDAHQVNSRIAELSAIRLTTKNELSEVDVIRIIQWEFRQHLLNVQAKS